MFRARLSHTTANLSSEPSGGRIKGFLEGADYEFHFESSDGGLQRLIGFALLARMPLVALDESVSALADQLDFYGRLNEVQALPATRRVAEGNVTRRVVRPPLDLS